MRKLAKRFLRKIHLDDVVMRAILRTAQIKRKLVGHSDSTIIENYFAEQKTAKLHIGCGGSLLEGWLNSDVAPYSSKVLQLDATTMFPFADETFAYVFSEHMIEHISYAGGSAMLSECYRVLRKNGKIRISTPDLRFLIDLYSENKSPLQQEYIKWASDSFIGAPYYDDTFVINNFVRDWGHLLIYDEKTLRSSLGKAGFTDIVRCELNESEDDQLKNLEHEGRMPKGFLRLESFTLEATK
jgi:predicted SAM-dependent methyltransferase